MAEWEDRLAAALRQPAGVEELFLKDVPRVPPEIGRLHDLKKLKLHGPFDSLPDSVWGLSKLEWLEIRGASLGALPPQVAQLRNLGGLEVVRSGIDRLPPE